jgi:hypothetical protein
MIKSKLIPINNPLISSFDQHKQSTMFGLEEDAKLENEEKVKIINSITTKQGGGKHTDYKIMGRWRDEQFIIMRRYKEFHLLRKRLEERWHGFYIPPIPPKKTMGKMNSKVIEERMIMLNRFLTELADRHYFWESEEMRIFIRPETNVISELKILRKLSVEEILERIRNEADINIQTNDIGISDFFDTVFTFNEQVKVTSFLNNLKI